MNNSPRQVKRFINSDTPITFSIIVICVVLWLGQVFIPSDLVTLTLAYLPAITEFEPWRMLTTGFLHSTSSPLHLGLNMYTLYIFGRALEPILGKLRFLVLYVISLFAGSVAVLWLNDAFGITVGASGAIFGLMGGYLMVNRSLGYGSGQITSLIAINLVFSFLLPGISWQAHVGGLVAGLVVGFIYSITRRANDKTKQLLMLVGFAVFLVAATVVGVATKISGIY
ncbi:MAG: rhomboid family intramembrane serine protease [Micrococcales bacterium]